MHADMVFSHEGDAVCGPEICLVTGGGGGGGGGGENFKTHPPKILENPRTQKCPTPMRGGG